MGHCIALGIDSKYFAETIRKEAISERIDQLNWELEHYNELIKFGDYYSKKEIESNLKNFQNYKQENEIIEINFDENTLIYLNTMQNYIMNHVKESAAVIESCPSSNYYIGMIHNPNQHPLKRFIKNKIKVTIGSDDPGIFDTSLEKEYTKASEMGLSAEELENIRKESFLYKSSILSGRGKSS